MSGSGRGSGSGGGQWKRQQWVGGGSGSGTLGRALAWQLTKAEGRRVTSTTSLYPRPALGLARYNGTQFDRRRGVCLGPSGCFWGSLALGTWKELWFDEPEVPGTPACPHWRFPAWKFQVQQQQQARCFVASRRPTLGPSRGWSLTSRPMALTLLSTDGRAMGYRHGLLTGRWTRSAAKVARINTHWPLEIGRCIGRMHPVDLLQPQTCGRLNSFQTHVNPSPNNAFG